VEIASSIGTRVTQERTAFLPREKSKVIVEAPLPTEEPPPEVFSLSDDGLKIYRKVRTRNRDSHATVFKVVEQRRPNERSLGNIVDQAFLRSSEWPAQGNTEAGEEVRTADVFSGCGAMSLGVWEACRAVGKLMRPVLAVDSNPDTLNVYKKNFPCVTAKHEDIRQLLDSPLGARPSASEQRLVELAGRIDLLLGGPPCQGHSDLNNHTRRIDAKNQLYERMARFAELVRPMHLIIENVPAVLRDKRNVVNATVEALRKVGYNLGHGIVELSSLGVPQRRRRHILVASLAQDVCLDSMIPRYQRSVPTVKWAIADLRSNVAETLFDTMSTPTPRNRERIEYLFSHGCYDLPDSQRPDCHRLFEHTYRSVYGRLQWDKPAQTITSGFGCMGQGRFVHPAEKRTITPHEAARLQFIPDFFSFDGVTSRTALAQMIGNAVPPKLTYVVALELIR
jgi:DNA (cytosine-5)-methyltransferase 1